tara:strand:+ start:769 stop:2409 length:1641 start_codon:yes stop_codon:yes gene_type:complete
MNKTNQNIDFEINRIIELYKKGFLDEAKTHTIKLLQTNSNIAFLHNLLGAINYSQGNLYEAKISYKKATLVDKKYSEAFNNLGAVYIELNMFDNASEALFKAIKLNPNLIDAYINLGKLASKYKNYNQEIIYYQKALQIDPRSDIANNNLAAVYISKGDLANAKKYLENTLEINPKFYQALTNIGGIYLAEGDTEKAIIFYKKAIEINPDYAEAYRLLFDNLKINFEDPLIQKMIEIDNKSNISQKDKMHINFALAKVYENLDNYIQAYNYLLIGNKVRKLLLDYDIEQDKTLFNSIKLNYQKIDYKYDIIEKPNYFKTPIFIVGMPRSGTTLVEQIISSHSSVYGAGELTLVDEILAELKWNKVKIDKKFISDFREMYLKKISLIDTNKIIISDKMPINFRWLGIILSAIPEAKIIHTERNPKATMWSIFKHYFTSEGNGYAYDLNDIQGYYTMYKDLMSYWTEQFKGHIYSLDYEKLIQNQETVSKELINFLDLEWEKECLEFYNNKRSAHTASAAQVRKKIYQGSSNVWEKYESLLPKTFLKY